MARYKQVEQTFMLRKILESWGNIVENFDDDCRDRDFFEVADRCFDRKKSMDLIRTAYTKNELDSISNGVGRCRELDFDDTLGGVFYVFWNSEGSREKCRVVLNTMRRGVMEGLSRKTNEAVERRFAELKRSLKLSDLEIDILVFAYIRDQTCFCWPRRIEDREKPLYYAMALDRSFSEVSQAMSPGGRLLKFGLLDDSYDFGRHAIGGFMDGVASEPLERRFYTRTGDGDILPWSFYGDLASGYGAVAKSVVAASGGKCNILLYGAPGTGKTSFARSLARELGRESFEIRQGDVDGRNMKSEARMMGIEMCNNQESPTESLMIVDESDELLRGSSCGFGDFGFGFRGGKSTEKGVMNTILDEMRIPAIWISNAPAESMDESVRRRFDYSICFERLNNVQRAAIWRNLVVKHGLVGVIDETKIEVYASKYPTNAGGISTVLANVKRMNPTQAKVDDLVEMLMKPHCRLMGIKNEECLMPAKDYSLEGLNIKGKVSLERIIKAARNYLDTSFSENSVDGPRMNVLLFGPPGTGKTEFVKYLGKELDRKVMVVKGSDLLSKWVGESEQNIARAFRRAESEHAILFFDEVDGLLQDRESATASWQVSQVNEILQQMENFGGIMIAATNFSKNLDPATMRRFTFKLEFDYLDDDGKRLFFERLFKTTLSENDLSELRGLENLAPGDFRTVRQEMFYLGEDANNRDRINALKEECKVKKDGNNRAPIGFG